MKLITKVIEEKLPKLYSTESIPTAEKKVICKFFTPYVKDSRESGYEYFRLRDFEEIRGMFGLKVERDLYFRDGETLGEALGCLII